MFWVIKTVGLSTLIIDRHLNNLGVGTTAGAVYVIDPSWFTTAVPSCVAPGSRLIARVTAGLSVPVSPKLIELVTRTSLPVLG